MGIEPRALSFPASYLAVTEGVLAGRAADFDAVLQAGGVTRAELARPGATLDGEQLRAALRVLLRRCDPTRPPSVQVLERFSLAGHGLLGLLSMTAETVEQALEVFLRFLGLVMPAFTVTRHETGASVELHVQLVCDFGELSPMLTETFMGGFRQIVPFVQGAAPGHGFRFAHASQYALSSYHGVFGEDLVFGAASNKLILERRSMQARLLTHSAPAHAQMLSTLGLEAARSPAVRPYTDRVRRALCRALDQRIALELPTLARSLGLSARTLSRRLQEEQTSLPELQAAVRIERARDLLASGRLSVAEVAYAVGYHDAGSFARAFKRATGASPSAARGSPT